MLSALGLLDIDRDLEDQANDLTSCPICMDQFDNPKVLPCQHTFCLSCIQSHYVACNKQRMVPLSNFPCPTCRAICYVPRLGLHSLPSDFKVEQIRELMRAMATFTGRKYFADSSPSNSPPGASGGAETRANSPLSGDGAICAVCRCLGTVKIATSFCAQCSKHFCSECSDTHCKNPIFAEHSILPISPTSTDAGGWKCEAHQAEMTYFCQKCSVPACMLCVTCSHEGHSVVSRAEAIENVRRKTVECGELMTCKLKEIDTKMDVVKHLKQDHSRAMKEAEKTVKKSVKELELKLKDIEKQMLSEIKSEYEGKILDLTSAEKHFQDKQKMAKGLSTELQGFSFTQNIREVLNNFYTIEDKINNSFMSDLDIRKDLFQYLSFKQNPQASLGTLDTLTFTSEQRRASTVVQVEQTRTKTSTGTKISRLKELRNSFRLSKSSFQSSSSSSITTVTNGGAAVVNPVTPASPDSAGVEPESGRSRTLKRQALVEQLERRLSTVGGLTPSPGGVLDSPGLRMSLGLSNRRKSSPGPARARQSSGGPGARLLWKVEGYRKCRDCCFTSDGQLAVADYAGLSKDRLKIYDSSGELLHQIDSVLISEPWGLAFNKQTSSLIITDHGGSTASILNIKIADISQLARYKCVSYTEKPTGVACLSNGHLVMTDTNLKRNKVGIYTMMIPGRFSRIREFGPRGDGQGEVMGANYVTVDREDRIIVSDYESKKIKVFTSQGQQALRFSHSPAGKTWLPQGVTTDHQNNILVADQSSGSVIKFTPDGQQVGVVAKLRSNPWGLAYNEQSKRLAVVLDSGVEVYQM